MFNSSNQSAPAPLNLPTEQQDHPIPLDFDLLKHVAGGGPAGGWSPLEGPSGGW